jgi:hypothetical protein
MRPSAAKAIVLIAVTSALIEKTDYNGVSYVENETKHRVKTLVKVVIKDGRPVLIDLRPKRFFSYFYDACPASFQFCSKEHYSKNMATHSLSLKPRAITGKTPLKIYRDIIRPMIANHVIYALSNLSNSALSKKPLRFCCQRVNRHNRSKQKKQDFLLGIFPNAI